jgi:hypothetical protein
MSPRPDFDDLVGRDLPAEERERLRRAHELLLRADPPPEFSPGLDVVPWPEEALQPLFGSRTPRRRRPVLLAVSFATAVVLAFVIGQATKSTTPTSIDAVRTVKLAGTSLNPGARATIELGRKDDQGNWPMVLRATGLKQLPEGGYYDLYLTRGGKPLVLCGTFNANGGAVAIRLTAAYELQRFDWNGWVVTRQLPGNHEPTDVVLKPAV